jgi:class 3 adenylate cyclase/tetratricopeptide (TPR) repeat protein
MKKSLAVRSHRLDVHRLEIRGLSLDPDGTLGGGGPSAYTPPHLAAEIIGTRSGLEGERKLVTILFCDVVGSTALAERLGAEAMHALLGRFFGLTLREVHRYEGTVNQFLGDGFMALFGAPVAREDHARRAVLAALGIQRVLREERDALGLPDAEPLSVRMGINTGLVVVGSIGDNLRMDYTAIGDATNVAGRLEEHAEPDTILIGASTARFVEGYVRLAPQPPLTLKGKAEPVVTYRVIGPGRRRSRLERPTEEPLGGLVGRERELQQLWALVARAEAGAGQVVGISGEAGVGKSRLLHELRRRLGPRTVTWLEGQCRSYGQSIPYLPVLDVIRDHCGIGPSDAPKIVADKAREGLLRLGLDPEEHAGDLLHLLGVDDGNGEPAPLGPETRRARSVQLLGEMVKAGSRRRPLVLVVEDVQWIDDASEQCAAALTDTVTGAPVLLILTYRTGFAPSWMERAPATRVELGPLSPVESRAVLSSTLTGGESSEPLVQRILDRASGNPLFLEELARVAGTSESGPVPDTIQDVLAARIDGLSEASRRVLRMAAVIGREVSAGLLTAVWRDEADLEAALGELARLDFLHERPGAQERTYVFKHALVQQVAYEGLLEGQRRRSHARVGRALEALYARRTDEVAELLAHHFERSDEVERAVDYTILAAEKAQRRWANAEALVALDTALARLDGMPGSEANRRRRIDIVIKQAEVKFALGRHAEHREALERIRDLVERSADPRRRAAWHYWQGLLASLTGGRPAVAIAECREAVAIADGAGLSDLRAFADCCLAQCHTVAGDLADALTAGERALTAFEARGNVWWASRALWVLSAASNAVGDWERGLGYCRRALAHATAVNDPRLRVSALIRTGSTLIQRGDADAGQAQCAAALALSPIPIDAAALTAIRGYGLIKTGRAVSGTAQLAEARAWYARAHLHYMHAQFGLWLAEGYSRMGDHAWARRVLREVLATSQELGYRHLEGAAHRLLAACGGVADADQHLAVALDVLEAVGARNELARALVVQGWWHRRRGETAAARRCFERSAAEFEALGTRDEGARIKAALATIGECPAI